VGNRSSIERLDPDIVAEVSRLIKGGRTIDEITTHLRGMDQDVSRSAVGRYVKSARKAMEDYQKAQEVAKVWVDRLEAEPNGDVARLLPQMLQAVAFKTIEGMTEGEEVVSPGDIMFMGKALQSIAGSSKTLMDIELKMRQVREDERRRLHAEQSEKLDAMNTAGGITAETKAAIRQALGIV
jgi:hypothetical protein